MGEVPEIRAAPSAGVVPKQEPGRRRSGPPPAQAAPAGEATAAVPPAGARIRRPPERRVEPGAG
jgi:hypothetical protein